jgi:hypothetical protein
MVTQKSPKISKIFNCDNCDYECCKISEWNKHCSTVKHKRLQNDYSEISKISKQNYECNCGKKYNHRQNLYTHKKKCTYIPNKLETTELTNDLVMKLINQNTELHKLLMEQAKETKTVTNTTNNTNNFNLNVFLNEKCKDALNLADFVEGLQVQLKDLEETALLGYTEGVSRIFINGLNELEVCKRPIHCSDAKRETLYIKDQNEWSKEDIDKSHLSKAIKTVSNKNIQQIFEWQKKYPEYNDPESKQSDKYMEMICNTMSGSSKEEQLQNLNKIIKNISKETIIDKSS